MELNEFVEKYQKGLKKYLATKIPDHWTEADVEDLVQEVWIKVIREYNPTVYKLTRGWVKQVAHNVLVNTIKKEVAETTKLHKYNISDFYIEDDETETDEGFGAEPDILSDFEVHPNDEREEALDPEYLAILKDGIEKLSEPNRSVVADYVSGATEQELVSEYGLTRHQVRNIIKPE